MVTIRIPTPPPGLGVNLVGLGSAAALCVAVGGLTHNVWWAVLTGALIGLALVVVSGLDARAAARAAQETPRVAGAAVRPSLVPPEVMRGA